MERSLDVFFRLYLYLKISVFQKEGRYFAQVY